MINKGKFRKIVAGGVIGGIVTSLLFTSAFAESVEQTIKVAYNNIKIVIAGKQVNPTDASGNAVKPFVYNGTTYLPLRAISNALGKSVIWNSKTNTIFLSDASYKDGTYKAAYDKLDSHGWKGQVELTIKGNEITACTFDYVNKDGALKSKDAGYNSSMLKVAKTNPEEFSAKLPQDLLNKQNVDAVDTVTGATHSTKDFKDLVAAALAKAAKGDTTTAILTLVEEVSVSYKDGTYKATYDKLDSHGWNAQVELTIKDNKITFCTYDYVNKDGAFKSKDAGYNTSMKAKSGTNPQVYVVQLAQDILKKQNAAAVDVVTGATHSSNNFKELAAAALEHAKTGDTKAAVLPQKE